MTPDVDMTGRDGGAWAWNLLSAKRLRRGKRAVEIVGSGSEVETVLRRFNREPHLLKEPTVSNEIRSWKVSAVHAVEASATVEPSSAKNVTTTGNANP